jgi:hypothetical protein
VAVTLDKIIKSYGISKIDKRQTISLVHRFGTNGAPIESEFGAILPWRTQGGFASKECRETF